MGLGLPTSGSTYGFPPGLGWGSESLHLWMDTRSLSLHDAHLTLTCPHILWRVKKQRFGQEIRGVAQRGWRMPEPLRKGCSWFLSAFWAPLLLPPSQPSRPRVPGPPELTFSWLVPYIPSHWHERHPLQASWLVDPKFPRSHLTNRF